MKNLKRVFNKIGKLLVKEFKTELEQQGHRASKSGSIIDGLRFTTSDTELKITTDKAYAAVLNDGAKPHFPNTDAIEDWVRKKGFASDEKEVKRIAYAVALRISKEGTPTKESYSPSITNNGRRTGFIEQVINTNKQQITKDIQSAVGKDIEILFTKLPKEI
jgi:hypothetical protein